MQSTTGERMPYIDGEGAVMAYDADTGHTHAGTSPDLLVRELQHRIRNLLSAWTKTATRRRLRLFLASRKRSERFARTRGRDVKFVPGLLAAGLFLADVEASHAVVRISGDRGGRIETYLNKFESLRTSGETVIIDGLCLSACTIVLGSVPHDKICVTPRATLGFHAAYDFGANRRTITNREATQQLYSMYPMPVQSWIAERGGLTPRMILLRGKPLRAMYKLCDLR